MKKQRTNSVYVVDYSVAAPRPEELVSVQHVASYLTAGVEASDDKFITSLLEKVCMYDKHWFPRSMQNLAFVGRPEFSSFNLGLDVSNEEAEVIVGRALEELFERSGVGPSQVDVVVCVSTLMTRIQDTILRPFFFRDDVEVLTLGGMGCAAAVAATDFCQKFLSERPRPTTMIAICHENLTRGFYSGLARESMVSNVLFRTGASAMMFTTDPALKARAKFKLGFSTRTYQTDDLSFWSMGYKLDASGAGGIFLPKKEELGDISARAIGRTIGRVGREILPLSEKLKYVLSGGKARPDFLKSVDHIVVHPGGPAVIEKIGKALGYDAAVHSINSINAYYFYGNTSSAGVVYSLSYTESLQGIKKGEKLLSLGLGAGFESNAVVMTAVRDCKDVHRAWRHVVEDPSLEPLAVDAFVRGFRNRERICTLESSDERKVRDLIEIAKRNGIDDLYGPDARGGKTAGVESMLGRLSLKVADRLFRSSPTGVGQAESVSGSESTETVSSSVNKPELMSGVQTPPKVMKCRRLVDME